MTDTGKHSTAEEAPVPVPRGDHMWVLVLIGACVLLEVWASWVTIGSMAGFPRIGGKRGLPTDWVLAVTSEAYWGYALYAWLAASPGPRSRRFAMWSAAAVFVLSLVGQGASHLIRPGARPPAVLVVFVTDLPVLVLALIAILIHLRHSDREVARRDARKAVEVSEVAKLSAEVIAWKAAWGKAVAEAGAGRDAARAEAGAAAADERAALRAELDARETALETVQADLDTARAELAEALMRADATAQKLAAVSARKPRRKPAKSATESAHGEDATTELRAIMELRADRVLWKPRMGGELARRLGVSPATGRRLHTRYIVGGQLVEPPPERSPEHPGERSGERS